jgi:transposase
MSSVKQTSNGELSISFLNGYECIRHRYKGEGCRVRVHRLVAVAEHGIEAVKGKVVHHKNRIRFDNHPSNLELMEDEEHGLKTFEEDIARERKSVNRDRKELAELYYDKGFTIQEIAVIEGLSLSAMVSVFQELGLSKERTSRKPEENPWSDEELMRQLYVDEQMSIQEVADHLDCHRSTIKEWLCKHDIEIRESSFYDGKECSSNSLNNSNRPWEDTELLKEKYVEQGKGMKQIADEWDTTQATVKRSLQIKDIEIRQPRGKGDRPKPWRDEDTLRELYDEKGMTQVEMANELGCSNNTIHNWIKKHDIERR